MPKPISRRELIRKLREFGWSGPFPGKRHQFMSKSGRRISIPNPHRGDIDWSLTKQLIQQAGIDIKDWDRLS
ncbi:MAG: type II toxin-antitoxin system HicA family toxin [Chthoniobacteraceae bacterium]